MTVEPVGEQRTAAALPSPIEASAPPRREYGVRSRAGNAMGRTRSAVIEGALRAVAANGARRTTMADIAKAAGVAKGTLYNHFRTKEAVFDAVLQAEVERITEEAVKAVADGGLRAGLETVARSLSSSPAVVTLRGEPAALLPLLTVTDAAIWKAARDGVAEMLRQGSARSDAAAVDLALRWLLTHLASPAVDGVEMSAAYLSQAVQES